jgi:hydrogenase maturation protease
MSRNIIIGFGNIDRADDGVAYVVVNKLRERLKQKKLGEEDSGLEELGSEPDSIFLHQLVPEIMDLLIDYDQIIFVDAHVGDNLDDLNHVPVLPDNVSSTFTHHMTPSAFLSFLKILYHHEATGHLISIRGHNFDFNRNLSPETSLLIDPAVEKIIQLMTTS